MIKKNQTHYKLLNPPNHSKRNILRILFLQKKFR